MSFTICSFAFASGSSTGSGILRSASNSGTQYSGGAGGGGGGPKINQYTVDEHRLNSETIDILIKVPGNLIGSEYFDLKSKKDLVREVVTDIKDNAISEYNFIKASSVLDGLNKNRFKAIDLWTDESSLNIELSGPSAGGGL